MANIFVVLFLVFFLSVLLYWSFTLYSPLKNLVSLCRSVLSKHEELEAGYTESFSDLRNSAAIFSCNVQYICLEETRSLESDRLSFSMVFVISTQDLSLRFFEFYCTVWLSIAVYGRYLILEFCRSFRSDVTCTCRS